MAELVSGFLIPHDPLIAAIPGAAPEAKATTVYDAFKKVAEEIRDEKIDTVIVIGDDHATVNGPACIPLAMIGIGEVSGPKEPWLGISRSRFENNEELAAHIMQHGLDNGIDWAVSKNLLVDHSITIPVTYAVKPVENVKSIPIYLNSGMEPFISSHRAYEIGQSIGEAIESWERNERVAIYGTGGISHWPALAEMGKVNEEWDQHILKLVQEGNVEELVAMSDEDILRDGGNGGLEIKNWLCAMGAFGATGGELIAYEAVPEWVCGLGFVELAA